MSKIATNEDFQRALTTLSLQQQRMVGALFIKNVLDLTEDNNLKRAQSIASNSEATAEELLEAYHLAHASYIKTNLRSGLNLLGWEKQAEHFVAEACMICLAPAYQETSTHHLATKVSMYCNMARTCANINHEANDATFENIEEVLKKEVDDQYRIATEFLENQ